MTPNILPYLRNTGIAGGLYAQVLYPFTRTVTFSTDVMQFGNGAEQRFANTPPLYGFELPMNALGTTDQAAWLTFFTANKGRYNTNLQLTLGYGGTAYSNLTLTEDTLSQTINRGGKLWDQTLRLRQTQNASWTPPSAPTAYPKLQFNTGAGVSVAEYPFTQGYDFLTFANDSPYGPHYSEAIYASGFIGFPATYLRWWNIEYPLITESDLALVENLFLAAQGRWISFSFTDPIDGTPAYSNVRFDQDQLAIKYSTKNQVSTSVRLVQTYNS